MTSIGPNGPKSNNINNRPSQSQVNQQQAGNQAKEAAAGRSGGGVEIGHPSLNTTQALVAALGIGVPKGKKEDPVKSEFGRDIPGLSKALAKNRPGQLAADAINNGELTTDYLNSNTFQGLLDGSFLA